MFMLITYDISDTKRRTKVSNLLESYGFRVNYSVFQLDIAELKWRRLRDELEEMTQKEDNVRVYMLDRRGVGRSFVFHSDKGVFTYEPLYF